MAGGRTAEASLWVDSFLDWKHQANSRITTEATNSRRYGFVGLCFVSGLYTARCTLATCCLFGNVYYINIFFYLFIYFFLSLSLFISSSSCWFSGRRSLRDIISCTASKPKLVLALFSSTGCWCWKSLNSVMFHSRACVYISSFCSSSVVFRQGGGCR